MNQLSIPFSEDVWFLTAPSYYTFKLGHFLETAPIPSFFGAGVLQPGVRPSAENALYTG